MIKDLAEEVVLELEFRLLRPVRWGHMENSAAIEFTVLDPERQFSLPCSYNVLLKLSAKEIAEYLFHQYIDGKLAGEVGIEPTPIDLESTIRPSNYSPEKWR